ncbi:unnamed protein product, partial [Musa acuminata subsp. burmannicoides]
ANGGCHTVCNPRDQRAARAELLPTPPHAAPSGARGGRSAAAAGTRRRLLQRLQPWRSSQPVRDPSVGDRMPLWLPGSPRRPVTEPEGGRRCPPRRFISSPNVARLRSPPFRTTSKSEV